MDNLIDMELLEQYLRGELPDGEIIDLELRLSKDVELSKQMEGMVEIQQGIRYARLVGLLEDIQKFENNEDIPIKEAFEEDVSRMIQLEKNRELFSEIQGFEEGDIEKKKVIVRKMDWNWLKIAAGFALALGACLYLLIPLPNHENIKLVANYFDIYPVIGNVRGNDNGKMKNQAYGDYLNKDFKKAISGFERLANSRDSLAIFYLGVSLLGNNNPRKSIETFQFFQDNYTFWEVQSDWYIGLAYLSLGENMKAIEYFSKVEENLEFKHTEAKKIQNQIIGK